MANTINVNQNNNTVSLQDNNRQVVVTDNNTGTTINVTQPVTSIVTVSALGPQGATGPAGPAGPTGSIDTGSFVTTSSFNSYTGSSDSQFAGTASFAITASYLDNYVEPFPYTGSALITGSLGITGSLSVSSSTITGVSLQAGRSLIQTSTYGTDGEILLDTNYGGYDSSLLYLYSGSNGDDYSELSALGSSGFIGFYLDNYNLGFDINANDYQYKFYTQTSRLGKVLVQDHNLEVSKRGTNTFNSTSSFAIGQENILTGSYVATIGDLNTINGQNSLTIGSSNTTLGNNHLIVGQSNSTLFTINNCLMVGNSNQTLGKWEIGAAFGSSHTLNAESSFAQGNNNTINGTGGHAEGRNNALLGIYSHVEGFNNSATGSYSHAEGDSTIAIGDASHAEGYQTTTSGRTSHAEGEGTTASGNNSHAEGEQTVASGRGSHAEGILTTASGNNSHAEGSESVASGNDSHAEGIKGSTASGGGAHAEGINTRATANGAHSEGDNTTASGEASHAEGNSTVALGLNSHTEGLGTIASGSYQHAQGKYNTQNNTSSLMIIGNGADEFSRSDLALFNTDGIVFNQPLTGSIISGSFVGDGSNITGVISSSYAITASYAENAGGGSGFPFSGSAIITGSLQISSSTNQQLTLIGSGSDQPIFRVQGSAGELFSITDNLSGSLFAVNNISGLPILEVFSDDRIIQGDYAAPMLTTTVKNTVSAVGAFTVYELPTASYDGAFFEYTARSGSDARAGQIMSIWSGSQVNFTETTTTDFGSTTGLAFTMIVTGSNFALTGSVTTADWTIKTIVRSI